LGFELVDIQAGKFVWVSSGPMSILLRPGKTGNATPSYDHASMGLVLYSDNLDHIVQELTARGLTFRGNDGSPRCVTFTDSDGHWFQLVNPAEH
jgi:hypothetical protein